MTNIRRYFAILLLAAFTFALIPPASKLRAQFGSQSGFAPAPSTGSANTQSLALANYSLGVGIDVTFSAGFGNTGPATLNINGTGDIAVWRATNVGITNTVGGELVTSNYLTVFYDGSHYVIKNVVYQVGSTISFRGPSNQGYQVEDGSCQSATAPQFAVLFSIIGTSYGTCGAGTFKIPDTRSRWDAGLDDYGTGAANRLTSAASGCGTAFTSRGVSCANEGQSTNITTISQLPLHTPTGVVGGTVGAPTITMSGNAFGALNNVSGAGANVTGGGGTYFISAFTATASVPSFSGTFTGNAIGASAPIPAFGLPFGTTRAIKL